MVYIFYVVWYTDVGAPDYDYHSLGSDNNASAASVQRTTWSNIVAVEASMRRTRTCRKKMSDSLTMDRMGRMKVDGCHNSTLRKLNWLVLSWWSLSGLCEAICPYRICDRRPSYCGGVAGNGGEVLYIATRRRSENCRRHDDAKALRCVVHPLTLIDIVAAAAAAADAGQQIPSMK